MYATPEIMLDFRIDFSEEEDMLYPTGPKGWLFSGVWDCWIAFEVLDATDRKGTSFLGMEATSSWIDGKVGAYIPSVPEVVLGVSGISLTMFLTGMALKILPFLPDPVVSGEED